MASRYLRAAGNWHGHIWAAANTPTNQNILDLNKFNVEYTEGGA